MRNLILALFVGTAALAPALVNAGDEVPWPLVVSAGDTSTPVEASVIPTPGDEVPWPL